MTVVYVIVSQPVSSSAAETGVWLQAAEQRSQF